MKLEELKESIENITEPRRVSYGNIRHKLDDIIIIGLCTVICGGEDYNDMEAFGLEREEWLRTFLELPNGIPDSDTFRRLFERLNPSELSECLNSWLEIEREKRSVVAIDGKTIRGSGNANHKAYHVVSAFVAENQKRSVRSLKFSDAVRKHWSIENQFHWNLDVIFHEDAARARKDNSPLNMNILRKMALALVNQAKYGRISKKRMMFKAALNPQILLHILFPAKK